VTDKQTTERKRKCVALGGIACAARVIQKCNKMQCDNRLYSLMFNLKVEVTGEPIIEPRPLDVARRIQLHTASPSTE